SFLLFFLYCYADHLDLLSFPTRRSSDLVDLVLLGHHRAVVVGGGQRVNYIRNSVKATVDAYSGEVKLYQWDTEDPVLKTWMKALDRKSTRLNSSHVKISYAVFCLKKKKR